VVFLILLVIGVLVQGNVFKPAGPRRPHAWLLQR